MRRVALLVLLVALTGCSVGEPAATDTPTLTVPDVVTPTETPTAAPLPEPTRTPSEANTVAFEDLPVTSQQAFERTRRPNGLAKFAPESPYLEGDFLPPEAAGPFADHEYVEKNGSLYRISLTQGELYASYHVRATPETPDGNATVREFANLSAEHREAVRGAVENGSYATDLGEPTTVDALAGEFVRYEGDPYRLEVAVGDYWVRVLRTDPV